MFSNRLRVPGSHVRRIAAAGLLGFCSFLLAPPAAFAADETAVRRMLVEHPVVIRVQEAGPSTVRGVVVAEAPGGVSDRDSGVIRLWWRPSSAWVTGSDQRVSRIQYTGDEPRIATATRTAGSDPLDSGAIRAGNYLLGAGSWERWLEPPSRRELDALKRSDLFLERARAIPWFLDQVLPHAATPEQRRRFHVLWEDFFRLVSTTLIEELSPEPEDTSPTAFRLTRVPEEDWEAVAERLGQAFDAFDLHASRMGPSTQLVADARRSLGEAGAQRIPCLRLLRELPSAALDEPALVAALFVRFLDVPEEACRDRVGDTFRSLYRQEARRLVDALLNPALDLLDAWPGRDPHLERILADIPRLSAAVGEPRVVAVRQRVLPLLARVRDEENLREVLRVVGVPWDPAPPHPREHRLSPTDLARQVDRGDPAALCEFGLAYVEGRPGIKRDAGTALRWLRQAAEAGYGPAQLAVGLMRWQGTGAPADAGAAYAWFRQAAEQGLPQAQCAVALALWNGVGTPQDDREAVRWFLLAARQGDATSQLHLGLAHDDGRGVGEDPAEAAAWYRRAAEQDDAIAQDLLGTAFARGHGVAADPSEAARWWRRAAEKGYASAQRNLGFAYWNGAGVSRDDREAVRWFQLAAEQNDDIAQSMLGMALAQGRGIAADPAGAVPWYRRAAEQGNDIAQSNLAHAYWNGNGVVGDDREAVRWFQLSAERGNAIAQNMLGVAYAQGRGIAADPVEAARWYRRGAEQGNALAQGNIGFAYWNGNGVTQDDGEAVRWFRLAAEQGNAMAQNMLGVAYAQGRGIATDPAEAARWYRRAAEQGDVVAQSNIGFAYWNGNGVTQDDREAVRWFRLAAEQGRDGNQYMMGIAFEQGRGVSQDHTEAVAWHRRAAEQGHAGSQTSLGTAYRNGRGVAQSDTEALRWWRRAAEQGNRFAEYNLGLAYENGWDVAADRDQALAWYRRSAASGHERALAKIESLTRPPPPPAPAAFFDIQLDPANATLTLDGQRFAVGRIQAEPGRAYEVRAEAPGFTPYARRHTLADGQTLALSIVLSRPRPDPPPTPPAPAEAYFDIRVTPANATLTLNGRRHSPGRITVQPGQRYEVRIEADGYQPYAQSYTLQRGETRPLTIELRQAPRRGRPWAL